MIYTPGEPSRSPQPAPVAEVPGKTSNYYLPLLQSLQPETQNMIRTIMKKIMIRTILIVHNLLTCSDLMVLSRASFTSYLKSIKLHSHGRWPIKIPPGRPIVSDCGSESYRIAEYIDHFINPLAKLHPSYIKDTYDLVDKLKSLFVPADSFLFTIDV